VWVLEPIVTRRSRFASLLPVVVYLVLRALAHAYPMPLPWTGGVFDGGGLDDVLQTIRTSYASSPGAGQAVPEVLGAPTGQVAITPASLVRSAVLSTAHSRAPPRG
jgi:hypothetical protein